MLLDLNVAAEAQPDAALPAQTYPGGRASAQWHLRHGRAVFERFFGAQALGCWPSEGALSNATLQLLADEGFAWTASGESVLRHSRAAAQTSLSAVGEHACRHRVYRVGGNEIACFFRDDGLSDLIGFSYADWHAEDAVANLLHHMETIAATCPDHRNCAISIILDGENAWEYYPDNAYYFLSTLYRKLAVHPHLKLSTFSDFLRANRPTPVQLPALVAGSWVYGTLSTWIGSADKNRGWDMLIEAKQVFDRALAANALAADQAERARLQLAVCEGSDWFWWFGDYNPAQTVSDFERLFRAHLTQLYQMLDVAVPAYLAHSFTHGSGAPVHGGVMRQTDTADSGA